MRGRQKRERGHGGEEGGSGSKRSLINEDKVVIFTNGGQAVYPAVHSPPPTSLLP